jgi:hypothetical protein
MVTLAQIREVNDGERFHVVHPLRDAAEQKCESTGLGPLAMTRSVRIALMALRGYLVLMSLILLYHMLVLAGVVRAV